MGGENRLSRYDTTGARPYYFSISGTTLRVTPITAGNVTLTYFEKIPALDGTTNTTNWLLTLAPDIYFYRCIAEAHSFIRKFDVAAQFAAHAEGMIEELNEMDQLARYANAETIYDGTVDG